MTEVIRFEGGCRFVDHSMRFNDQTGLGWATAVLIAAGYMVFRDSNDPGHIVARGHAAKTLCLDLCEKLGGTYQEGTEDMVEVIWVPIQRVWDETETQPWLGS